MKIDFNNLDISVVILVFFSYILIDGLYAYYTLAVVDKKPIKSAFVGSFMHFIIAFGVINYVKNYLYVIPLALGSFVGTYFVVKYYRR